jgi:hypothetical protein
MSFYRSLATTFSVVSSFVIVTAAQAAPYGFPDPLNSPDVPTLVNRIVTAVLGLIGALFFIMFLWGGFQYMTAGGDAKQVQSSRTTLLNAVIGMAIIAMAYGIVNAVIESLVTATTA